MYEYRDILTPKRCKLLIVCKWVYAVVWGVMVHFNPDTMTFDAVNIRGKECGGNNQMFNRVSYVMVFMGNFHTLPHCPAQGVSGCIGVRRSVSGLTPTEFEEIINTLMKYRHPESLSEI